MALYKNEKWGEDKMYSLTQSVQGVWKLIEYQNKCRKTELTLDTEQKTKLLQQLEGQGFYEYFR